MIASQMTRRRWSACAVASLLLIDSLPTWAQPATDDTPTRPHKKITKKHPRPATVYKSGSMKLVWGGFPLPAAKPNETGPYVFKNIDLDEGVDPNRTTRTADIEISLEARSLGYSVSSTNGTRVVMPMYQTSTSAAARNC